MERFPCDMAEIQRTRDFIILGGNLSFTLSRSVKSSRAGALKVLNKLKCVCVHLCVCVCCLGVYLYICLYEKQFEFETQHFRRLRRVFLD